jgi:hypothetical protein
MAAASLWPLALVSPSFSGSINHRGLEHLDWLLLQNFIQAARTRSYEAEVWPLTKDQQELSD